MIYCIHSTVLQLIASHSPICIYIRSYSVLSTGLDTCLCWILSEWGLFFQTIQVILDPICTLRRIWKFIQLAVIHKFAKHARSPIIQIINREKEQYWSQVFLKGWQWRQIMISAWVFLRSLFIQNFKPKYDRWPCYMFFFEYPAWSITPLVALGTTHGQKWTIFVLIRQRPRILLLEFTVSTYLECII